MKLNLLLLYVSNLGSSSDFYKNLGFKLEAKGDFIDAKLKDFTLRLLDEEKAHFKQESKVRFKGGGLYIYIEVENVNEFFKKLRKKGFFASNAPRDWPWGNREFALRDPDNYKLIFYEKLS